MTDFRVGQKVECIQNWDALKNPHLRRFNLPEVGGVYTIRAIGMLIANDDISYPALWLNEIGNETANFLRNGVKEPGFWAAYFRPLEEQSSAIQLFRQIAADASKHRKITVDA